MHRAAERKVLAADVPVVVVVGLGFVALKMDGADRKEKRAKISQTLVVVVRIIISVVIRFLALFFSFECHFHPAAAAQSVRLLSQLSIVFFSSC